MQFILHLCRTVAHDLNWERALAGVEQRHLVVWEAFYRLYPWGDDWVQAARLEAAFRNSMGGQSVTAAELIPNEDNRDKTDEVDDARLEAHWAQRWGR